MLMTASHSLLSARGTQQGFPGPFGGHYEQSSSKEVCNRTRPRAAQALA